MSRKPQIIVKLFGEKYDGPFSHFDEWHAMEYGALFGMWAAFTLIDPVLASALLAAIGVKSITSMATKGLRKQIKEERHYFIVGAAGMFVAVIVLAKLVGVQVTLESAKDFARIIWPIA